jgi:hypothetical protein
MTLPVHTPVGFSFIAPEGGIERVIYDMSSFSDIADINIKLLAGYKVAAVWTGIGIDDIVETISLFSAADTAPSTGA